MNQLLNRHPLQPMVTTTFLRKLVCSSWQWLGIILSLILGIAHAVGRLRSTPIF
jgi:hypothetical protein